MKSVGVLASVLALFAVGATSVSAHTPAKFTYSATGSLHGSGLENQVFTVNGGAVECTGSTLAGTVAATETEELEEEVAYSGCKAFGLVGVHITPARFRLTADGTVHVLNTIEITVTKTLFTGHCTITIHPQTLSHVGYANVNNMIDVTWTVAGLVYTSTGGVCGAGGNNGTITGKTTITRTGGGSIAHDPTVP